jgi:mono/diheme cytochrome c family protein
LQSLSAIVGYIGAYHRKSGGMGMPAGRITTALRVGLTAGVLAACGDGADGEARGPMNAGPLPEAVTVDLPAGVSLPEGVALEMAAEGRELYTVCAVCHGPDAAGTQLGPPLREMAYRPEQFDEIVEVIRTGAPATERFPVPMPVMGGGDFTPEQMRALAAYVYVVSHRAE